MFVMKLEHRQIWCGFHCKHVGNARKLCISLSTLWNDLIFHFSQVSYVNSVNMQFDVSVSHGIVLVVILQGIFTNLDNLSLADGLHVENLVNTWKSLLFLLGIVWKHKCTFLLVCLSTVMSFEAEGQLMFECLVPSCQVLYLGWSGGWLFCWLSKIAITQIPPTPLWPTCSI